MLLFWAMNSRGEHLLDISASARAGNNHESARQIISNRFEQLWEAGQHAILVDVRNVDGGQDRASAGLARRRSQNDTSRIGDRVERLRADRAVDNGRLTTMHDEPVAFGVLDEPVNEVAHLRASRNRCRANTGNARPAVQLRPGPTRPPRR